jgi:hypothetical protein
VFGRRAESKPAWKLLTNLHPTLGLRRASGTGSDPSRTSVETLGAPSTAPSSEELDPDLQLRVRAPKSSSARPHGLASTPPWKRLTTPGFRPSSEELDLELPTPSGAPKSTVKHQRETAPRLRGNALQPLTLRRVPKNPTSSCRRPQELRRAPSGISARPRRASVETPCNLSLSDGLRRTRPRAADSLRRAEEHRGQPARDRAAPPWKRSTTPSPQPGSEEPDLELPAPSSAPKNAVLRRRETASRFRGNDQQPLTVRRAPKNPTSSCRLDLALRRTPSRADARPRHASVRDRQHTPTSRHAPKDVPSGQ